MKFKTKLILMILLPVIASAVVAIIVSSNKLNEQGLQTLERKTKAILSRMEAVRTYIAERFDTETEIREIINKYPDGNIPNTLKEEVLHQVPIIASMDVGAMNAKQDSYEFRVASANARNKKNQATAQEIEFINQFNNNESLKDISYINKATNELWVMRPVRLSEKQGCLTCHGSPEISPWGNGKDVLDYPMEDYDDGHLAGLFILKSSLDANNSEVQANIKSAILNIVIVMLIVVALIVAIASGFIRQTNTKISNIIKANKRIAKGDLTTKVDIAGNDEFTDISEQLNLMIDSISDVVSSVSNVTQFLKDESTYSLDQSKMLADSANTQAASVEEISASMEEMTATIDQNHENAESTEKIAKTSAQEIREGNKSSQKAVESMNAIQNEITIIEDIAKQTNILALNAAVEAARAGEMGKGFAVVATEVRKLAENSRVSADKINKMFSEGLKTVDNTGKKLEELVPEIVNTASLVAEVAASSNEQSASANEINNSVMQLSESTQKNAQIADNMTQKAEELATKATELKERVAFFKTL